MLKINNLSISIKDKKIIDNLNLNINEEEIHVLMGKNGIGKSSLAKVICGMGDYQVEGKIYFNNEDITNLSIDERSRLGIYLINQSPIEIEGVTNAEMLRMAVSEKTNNPINIFSFNKELESVCKRLELDKSFIHRDINVNCSGGEKKKIELMHMWILKPSLIILDEIDSGLDVDAIKLVAKNISEYLKEYKASLLLITHSNNLINNFKEFYTHVIDNEGKIIDGDKSLAIETLEKGFNNNIKTNIISE